VKTRVRVKRAALMKVVDGRVRKAQNDYDRAVAAYPGKVEAWEAACVKALEKALDNAKRGKMPIDRNGSVGVRMDEKPMKPSEGRELCNLRRMLLSQEDADAYFGPCVL
jgi:hypothetical protein